jgi:N-acetylglucosamine kinase-like BadF-type ATPase
MSAILGVEGGGSHTHAVVVSPSGELLGAGANHDPSNWEDVGIEAAGASIKSCVRAALSSAGVDATDVAASVFALAGVDFPIDELRLSGVPEALGLGTSFQLMNDAFAALRAGTDLPFGVAVAAGTGSIVAGRNPQGATFRTLGLGPLFGDWGSASEVSEAGVSAVADAYTGRGPETELTASLCEAAGVESVVDFLEGAGRMRIDTVVFAPAVVGAAQGGDAVARGILRRAGEMLGAATVHVVRTLEMAGVEFDLVCAGGLLRSGNRDLVEALSSTVTDAAPGASLIYLTDPPVVGSALLALEATRQTPAPEVRTSLARATSEALGLPPR